MDNRYYFLEKFGDKVLIKGGEAQHLTRARRCRLGDKIVAFNGDGYDYHLRIDKIDKDKVECSILSCDINRAQQEADITVYLAMLKNDALTTAIDHLAELNVGRVKLFRSDYSVANLDEKKLNKLKSIAIQASKQCERADIMDISIIEKSKIKDDISSIPNCYFAYEDSCGKLESFNGDFALIIGAEGGFSPGEVEYFSSFAKNISLGSTILRAEVACIAGVAMLKAVNYAS